ncbi:MAG: DEAD/DEAH box helicase [Cyanobacteria bacterium P01_D01_bin.44]
MSEATISRFDELALAEPILKAIEQVGYESPSPIQAESIPPLLEGRDLLGQAQTGTGKTAAFALPLLSRLDLSVRKPQLLVLTPTRELALQVAEAVQTYARFLKGFHIIPIYGGQSMGMQLRQLNRGAHTVVGTPGRILDHLRRKTLDLSHLSAVVLDEADEMLRMGFLEDVETILKQTPEQRQVALFSATMSKPIKQIAQRYLQDPVEVRIKSKTATVSTITQRYWEVAGLHKLDALTRILEVEDFEAMLVFVRTKNATAELTEKLEARGYSCAMLSGDIKQVQREKTVDRLKNGSLDIVVATDVAARGLDVDRITHVVNYDVPYDTETYVHRIGRTGRAGRTGNAILFVTPREKRMLRAIERATRQPIEAMQVPSRADIVDRRVAQFKQLMTDTIEAQDLGFFEDLIGSYQQDHETGLSEIAAALAFLVQRERPLVVSERELAADKRRSKATPDDEPVETGMERYRIEVGRQHGVKPGNIVGAIANEVDLESRYIGRIKLYDRFSTVDLPQGMPKPVLKHLKTVQICGQALKIAPVKKTDSPSRGSKSRKTKAPKPSVSKSTNPRKKSSAKAKL